MDEAVALELGNCHISKSNMADEKEKKRENALKTIFIGNKSSFVIIDHLHNISI